MGRDYGEQITRVDREKLGAVVSCHPQVDGNCRTRGKGN